MNHKVWTFLLKSGNPVQISLPGNPPLDFQGKRLIWKIVSSKEVAEDALKLLRGIGIIVEMYVEEENEEMSEERRITRGE